MIPETYAAATPPKETKEEAEGNSEMMRFSSSSFSFLVSAAFRSGWSGIRLPSGRQIKAFTRFHSEKKREESKLFLFFVIKHFVGFSGLFRKCFFL